MAVGARPLVEVTGTCRFDLITVTRDLTTQESVTWGLLSRAPPFTDSDGKVVEV